MPRSIRFGLCLCVLGSCALWAMSAGLNAQSVPASAVSAPVADRAASRDVAAEPGGATDLTIAPDDVLDVLILDVPELSRQYRVSPRGKVVMPLLDEPLAAAGLKLTEFSSLLTQKLRDAGLVSHPSVVVSISASRLKAVAITGAVRMPQLYPVFGTTTLLDVLSQAQGLAEDAGSVAIISRPGSVADSGSSEHVQTVDLNKLLESGDPTTNVAIYPGDRITVPRAGIVYVIGAVNKPGGFPIKASGEGMTVLRAIALAESPRSTAKQDKTVLIRVDNTAAGGRVQLPLNLKRILSGQAQDQVLQADDVLFVPDSQSAKAARRGVEAVLQTVTGLAIYGRL